MHTFQLNNQQPQQLPYIFTFSLQSISIRMSINSVYCSRTSMLVWSICTYCHTLIVTFSLTRRHKPQATKCALPVWFSLQNQWRWRCQAKAVQDYPKCLRKNRNDHSIIQNTKSEWQAPLIAGTQWARDTRREILTQITKSRCYTVNMQTMVFICGIMVIVCIKRQ